MQQGRKDIGEQLEQVRQVKVVGGRLCSGDAGWKYRGIQGDRQDGAMLGGSLDCPGFSHVPAYLDVLADDSLCLHFSYADIG